MIPVARLFLKAYVAVNIFIILLGLVATIASGEMLLELSNMDWLIFIVACGALAISEALEGDSDEGD